MSATIRHIQRLSGSLLLVALFALPVAAKDISVDQFLDLHQYQMAIEEIDQATDASLTEELAEYMNSHSVPPHTALSRLGEEKIREWSDKVVFGVASPEAGEAEQPSSVIATRLKLQLDPLKERARLKIQGLVDGQIEVSYDRQVVSLDLFSSTESQMKLQYQHLSNPLGKQDQLQFRWHF